MTDLYIAAHFDDIVIGATGPLLASKSSRVLLLTTDDKLTDREQQRAIARSAAEDSRLLWFDEIIRLRSPDKHSHRHVRAISDFLTEGIERARPDRVFAPAFEGSNIDHEVIAILASRLQGQHPGTAFYEYALYHYGREGEPTHVHNRFPGQEPDRRLTSTESTARRDAIAAMLPWFPHAQHFLADEYESVRPMRSMLPIDPGVERTIHFKRDGITSAQLVQRCDEEAGIR